MFVLLQVLTFTGFGARTCYYFRQRAVCSFASCVLVLISMTTDGLQQMMNWSPPQHQSSCTLMSTTTSDNSFLSSLSTQLSLGDVRGSYGDHMWYNYLEKHTIDLVDA